MNQNKKEKNFNEANVDVLDSKFRHEIHFIPKNGQAPFIMRGYSGKMGFGERDDDNSVLVNLWLRLFKSGYLNPDNNRVDEIEKIDFFHNRDSKELIYSAYYDFPDWTNYEGLDTAYDKINKIYKAIHDEGFEVAYQRYYNNSRKQLPNDYSIDTPRFDSIGQLWYYAINLIDKKKRPKSEVYHFVRKYKDKYFSNHATGDSILTQLMDKFDINNDNE